MPNHVHLLAAARYIEMNPVAAKLAEQPEDYRWSSVHAHLFGKDDNLTKAASLLDMIPNWKEFLLLTSEEEVNLIHRRERTGRPLGTPSFIEKIDQVLQRTLRP